MKNDLPSSGVVIKVLYNSIHDADAHPPPLNRVKHYTHVMELCGCSMHKPRVYPHMHWRAPWGRGMTATNTTRSHSGGTHTSMPVHTAPLTGTWLSVPRPKPHLPLTGTWLYAAPPQAPPSTHWDMTVRWPSLSLLAHPSKQ